MKKQILILTGPTATGKSNLSIQIADKFNCEIVNIDSMQVYKYFNIGTDKPDENILKQYKHHLISYIEPVFDYDVKKYILDAKESIENIWEKNKIPLFVGGTGLYIKCLIYGLIDEKKDDFKYRDILNKYAFEYLYTKLKTIDFNAYKKINKNDKYRTVRALAYFYNTGKLISKEQSSHKFRKPLYNYFKIAINFNRENLYEKINKRVDLMIKRGLIEETEVLLKKGYEHTRPMNGIGYKEVKDFLKGKLSKKEAVDKIKQNTRKYAKRQITWFSKERDICWIGLDNLSLIFDKIEAFMEQ